MIYEPAFNFPSVCNLNNNSHTYECSLVLLLYQYLASVSVSLSVFLDIFDVLYKYIYLQGGFLALAPLLILEELLIPMLDPLLGTDKQDMVVSLLWTGPWSEVYLLLCLFFVYNVFVYAYAYLIRQCTDDRDMYIYITQQSLQILRLEAEIM